MSVVLTENQETDRVAKGYELFNRGYIEQLNDKEYLVNHKHIVTDYIDLGLICRCEDSYIRGVERCKHVIAIEFFLLYRNE